MQIIEDGWLSERFGHPVHTVSGPVDPAQLAEHARRQEAASYQARIPAGDGRSTELLTSAGFRVVSTAVTLERPVGAPAGDAPTEATVRGSRAGDAGLAAFAEQAFRTSRFHLDPAIPDELAGRIKHDWAENLLTGRRGDGCLVAELEGHPAGFLGILARDDAWIIDLVAVDPALQGRAAGRALVLDFLARARQHTRVARVGTQSENPGAIRFYERLGFSTARLDADLHMHVGRTWRDA